MSSLHDAARQYVAQGYRVFPITPNAKTPPLTPHGVHDASDDPVQIDQWWTRWPDANIGLSPGDTGCFVIDCDTKRDNGIQVWEQIYGAQGAISARIAETPSGGRHYWYAGTIKNSVGKIAPSIDTRCIGGYVLAPPSIVDGKPYSWMVYGEPHPLPEDLYQRISDLIGGNNLDEIRLETPEWFTEPGTDHAYRAGEAFVNMLIRKGDLPVEGNRDQHAIRVFIALYCRGLSKAQIVDLYNRFYDAGGVPPDNDEDLGEKLDRLFDGLVHCNAAGSELIPPSSVEFADHKPTPPPPPSSFTLPGEISEDDDGGIIAIRASDTEEEPVVWIMNNWLARGNFHILAGKAGIGKSTLAFNWLAAITTGGMFPDSGFCEPGEIAVWSSEDSWERTIVPRLRAAHADLTKCFCIRAVSDGTVGRRRFNPAMDVPKLVKWLENRPHIAAILIDPVVAMFGRGMDSHNNAQARDALQPLVDLADERHICLIGITHLNKKSDGIVRLADISGSVAITALARVVFGVGGGVVSRVKNNIGITGGGYRYTLEQVDEPGKVHAQRIKWGEFVEGDGEELTDSARVAEGGRFHDIGKWLMAVMHEAGDRGRTIQSLKEEAAAHGYNWKSVEVVRSRLKIESFSDFEKTRNGVVLSKKAVWHWRRTDKTPAPDTPV